MLSDANSIDHKTIEIPLAIVGSRYALTHALFKRVRAIHDGAPTGKHVNKQLTNEYKHTTMPSGRALKVALEEIVNGDMKFSHLKASTPAELDKHVEDGPIFTAEI